MTPPSLSRNKRTFWNVATLGRPPLERECVTGCKIVFNCRTRLCNLSFPYFYDEESKIHDEAVLLLWETIQLKRSPSPRNQQLSGQQPEKHSLTAKCYSGGWKGTQRRDSWLTPSRRCQSGGRDRLWNTRTKKVFWRALLCDRAHDEYGRLGHGLSALSLWPPLLMSQERWEAWPRFKSEPPDPPAPRWLFLKDTSLLSWGL